MAWTIDYADTAKGQLRKLDKQTVRRILDFMDERIAPAQDPRNTGKTLTGPLGGLWRYRVGDCRVICATFRMALCLFWWSRWATAAGFIGK